jgi:hypothetical protein
MRKSPGYWTKEKCHEEALKYSSKTELRQNTSTAYSIAFKNGWLDEICSHMKLKGNRFNRLIYAYEFSDKSVYVGLTYDIDNRQIMRDFDKNDPVNLYQNKTGLIPERKILTEFLDINIASEMEGTILNKYITDGWNILNRCKTGGLGGNNGVNLKWTKEKCLESAKKYITRNAWRIGDEKSAYDRALKIYGQEFFIECCKHMVDGNNNRGINN